MLILIDIQFMQPKTCLGPVCQSGADPGKHEYCFQMFDGVSSEKVMLFSLLHMLFVDSSKSDILSFFRSVDFLTQFKHVYHSKA